MLERSVFRIVLFLLLMLIPASAKEPARLALLIGNQGYVSKVGPLKNPHRDVELVAKSLKKLGFKVTVVKDADFRKMSTAIKRYISDVRRAGRGAISFFYYSGHGVANPDTKINYLIPVDVADANDDNLWFHSFEQPTIINQLSRQATNATHYVVFDACRNELNLTGPAAKALGSEKGFVPVQQTSGLLIAYATAPRQTASDFGDDGGPYARALAEELVKPDVEAVTMFRNVQIRVKQAIGQDPWLSFPSVPAIYLAGRKKPGPSAEKKSPVPAAKPSRSEVAKFCQSISTMTSLAVVRSLADSYKDTPMEACASARFEELQNDKVAMRVPEKKKPEVAQPSPPKPAKTKPRDPTLPISVSIDAIVNDAETVEDVVSNGLGPQGQRYSPLKTINKSNVDKLKPEWAFSLGGEKSRGQETQPLVTNGVMFVTGSFSRLWAVDTKTGRKIWQYETRLPEGILPCCDVVNRGAAIYGNKVFFGTLDAKLIALNAKTGKVVWSKKIDDFKAGFSYTAAPLIVPSKAHGPILVTGVSGGEFGIVGRVEARNVHTGELVWTRPVIEGHVGTLNGKKSTMTGKKNETWPGDLWKHGGGATWLGGTYDPDTKLIFIGTGNPAPWNSHMRPGDNRWSSARIAIDPETGDIKWGFQTTPNDGWSYDGVNELISFDIDGEKLSATADKNGFFYVLNRTNGEFIRGFPFVHKISWARGLDTNGRPIFDPDNRPGNPKDSKDGKKGKSVFAIPSFLGGKNWMPMAYSKDTKLFYVPSNEWGMDLWNEPVTYFKAAAYLGAGFTIKPIFDDHVGALKAVDPTTGKILWEYRNRAPLWGGVLTTAGGLVFFGTPEGEFKALDANTGKQLWSFSTGSGIIGSPITWEEDGEQYLSVVSGWGGAVPLWGGEIAMANKHLSQGGTVWTFKLP